MIESTYLYNHASTMIRLDGWKRSDHIKTIIISFDPLATPSNTASAN